MEESNITEKVFVVWAQLVDEYELSNSSSAVSTVTEMAGISNFTQVPYLSSTPMMEHVNSTLNSTSNSTIVYGAPIEWTGPKVGILIAQLLVMTETIFGNFLVVASVAMEKKLQTPFNYYIVNLALTDMNVGLSVMSLFTINNLYGYFPFDWYACCYWIWSDYTMTFESVATLAAISIDRFWSVTWTLHYRNNNSGRKSLIIILITWALVNAMWLPAFIYDRLYHEYPPGECVWDPARNISSVIYVGILGYYTPLLVMVAAYVRIFYVMRRRIRQIAESKKLPEASVVAVIQPDDSSNVGHAQGSHDQNQLVLAAAAANNRKLSKIAAKSDAENARIRKEKKAFYTLGHIVIAFLICWIPFYILFLFEPLVPGTFPVAYVEFAYWMAYLNSAMNPLVYGIGNDDFRRAFKHILTCQFCRKR